MSYELNSRQSLGENLRRIFRNQIDAALAVAHGRVEPDDTRVHALRKHLKKARAVLLMVRSDVARFRRQDRRLRDVGRLTRELRDAEARLQTLRQIKEQMRDHHDSHQKLERLLTLELENFVHAFAGWETQAVPLLESARKAPKKWSLDDYAWPELRRAIQRTYKCGRKAVARLQAEPSTTKLHQLRRWVKRLGYELRIIRPLNPCALGAIGRELAELGELLGHSHDLSVLANRLRLERRETHWGKQDDELLVLIQDEGAEREREGTKIAETFFAARPSEFGSNLKELANKRQGGKAKRLRKMRRHQTRSANGERHPELISYENT